MQIDACLSSWIYSDRLYYERPLLVEGPRIPATTLFYEQMASFQTNSLRGWNTCMKEAAKLLTLELPISVNPVDCDGNIVVAGFARPMVQGDGDNLAIKLAADGSVDLCFLSINMSFTV